MDFEDDTIEFVLSHQGLRLEDLPTPSEIQLGVAYYRDDPPQQSAVTLFENVRS